nr:uncharacterized protein LOC127347015 [Lolium perenne]
MRLGRHIIPAPPAASALPAAVSPAIPVKWVKRPSSKVAAAAPTPKKPAPKKAAKKLPAAKMASLTALTTSLVPTPMEPADARKVVNESPAVDDSPESYIDMLNDVAVDIDTTPLADYGDYNDRLEEGLNGEEFEEEEDTGSKEEDEGESDPDQQLLQT